MGDIRFWDTRPLRWSVVWKIDVLAALKSAGYKPIRLRDEMIIGSATVQRMRKGDYVSWDVLADVCYLLNCNVSDLIECRTETGEVAPCNSSLKMFPSKFEYKARKTDFEIIEARKKAREEKKKTISEE